MDVSQADAIARNCELDDLPAAVWQILVARGPSVLDNKKHLSVLALVKEFLAALNAERLGLNLGQARRFLPRQKSESVQFSDQGAC